MSGHLTSEEQRDRIAHLRSRGADQKEIADALERAPSTISREWKRNGAAEAYYAAQAQRAAEGRRRERPLSRKADDPKIKALIRHGLAQEWSPQQISGRLKQQAPDEPGLRVSAQTGIRALRSTGKAS